MPPSLLPRPSGDRILRSPHRSRHAVAGEASRPCSHALIQHGENDARVPIPNAYKLHQGLRDQEVPTELVVYEGFGHGITKPKERLVAMWHNWQWFAEHLWDDEVALPIEE
jgi:acetyl esterase/lipase